LLIQRHDLHTLRWAGLTVSTLERGVDVARADGADTLVTCGGLQSNHARATAAAGAVAGMKVILVLNGTAPEDVTGNLRLDALFGADVRVVDTRDARARMMDTVADEVRAAGGNPFVIPLGASNVTGAIGFARGVAELSAASVKLSTIPRSAGVMACRPRRLRRRPCCSHAARASSSIRSTPRRRWPD
jgi:1-aminocyclopropane-1-carboxylate deaminase/D-cysteine desulfhydrase-like pyridoxal-dependent ACC family enzyme